MSASPALRTAIYARVSTSDQDLDNQLPALRKYVAARGWIVAHEITDQASGAKRDRVGLESVMKLAHAREIDAVAVVQLDRFGRSLAHLLDLLGQLEALGVHFVSVADSIDTSTPAGRLFMQVRGAFAEYERGLLIERVKAGMNRAREAGKHLGRPRSVPRGEILELLEAGVKPSAIADQVSVSRQTVYRVKNSHPATSLSE